MDNNHRIGNIRRDSSKGLLQATPVNRSLAIKPDGFTSLVDALDYAARGESGFNFYNQHGELESVLSYSELRDQARVLAARLLGLGCQQGDRVGIVAETNPMFHRFFFACQYAGLVPVALPAGVQLGARQPYVNQLARMLKCSGASVAVASPTHAAFLEQAVADLDLIFRVQRMTLTTCLRVMKNEKPRLPVILPICSTRPAAPAFRAVSRSTTKQF